MIHIKAAFTRMEQCYLGDYTSQEKFMRCIRLERKLLTTSNSMTVSRQGWTCHGKANQELCENCQESFVV